MISVGIVGFSATADRGFVPLSPRGRGELLLLRAAQTLEVLLHRVPGVAGEPLSVHGLRGFLGRLLNLLAHFERGLFREPRALGAAAVRLLAAGVEQAADFFVLGGGLVVLGLVALPAGDSSTLGIILVSPLLGVALPPARLARGLLRLLQPLQVILGVLDVLQ